MFVRSIIQKKKSIAKPKEWATAVENASRLWQVLMEGLHKSQSFHFRKTKGISPLRYPAVL
jgi:hypothetical protein